LIMIDLIDTDSSSYFSIEAMLRMFWGKGDIRGWLCYSKWVISHQIYSLTTDELVGYCLVLQTSPAPESWYLEKYKDTQSLLVVQGRQVKNWSILVYFLLAYINCTKGFLFFFYIGSMFIIVALGIHCNIYKSAYNIS
jgi:hypothetical protein